jgi:hypothetical protein
MPISEPVKNGSLERQWEALTEKTLSMKRRSMVTLSVVQPDV